MAKQFGIHQIHGKVGDMSYYRQSGVKGGLIRGINPGMSNRVKTSLEYANTRLNNQEFATATKSGALLLDAVQPRFRPMFNQFRNARTSAQLLGIIKGNTGTWGNRMLNNDNAAAIASVMTSASKQPMSNLVNASLTFNSTEEEVTISLVASDSYREELLRIGADGVDILAKTIGFYFASPSAQGADGQPERSFYLVQESVENEMANDDTDIEFNAELARPNLSVLGAHMFIPFIYLVVLPYRMVGGQKHTLQEGCRFEVFRDSDYTPA